eukprot:5583049-Amphidinium_carterae.3
MGPVCCGQAARRAQGRWHYGHRPPLLLLSAFGKSFNTALALYESRDCLAFGFACGVSADCLTCNCQASARQFLFVLVAKQTEWSTACARLGSTCTPHGLLCDSLSALPQLGPKKSECLSRRQTAGALRWASCQTASCSGKVLQLESAVIHLDVSASTNPPDLATKRRC